MRGRALSTSFAPIWRHHRRSADTSHHLPHMRGMHSKSSDRLEHPPTGTQVSASLRGDPSAPGCTATATGPRVLESSWSDSRSAATYIFPFISRPRYLRRRGWQAQNPRWPPELLGGPVPVPHVSQQGQSERTTPLEQ
ncbi:unnamed protein product [Ixodes persulcatus]